MTEKIKANWIYIAAAALTAGLFWPILPALVQAWMEDPESSHCFLIPIVSGYLIWSKRDVLAKTETGSSLWGLAATLGGVLLYLLSLVGGIEVAQRVSLVTVINGLVLYNFGYAFYRQIMFPMLFLFLMIPIPTTLVGMISFPLQIFATTASKNVLLNLGVPVIQMGNILHTPKGSLEVVEACSGIRSLVSFFTLSLFFGYWTGSRMLTRSILVVSTVPIALAANVLRITFSGWIGFAYSMKLARGFMHDVSGFLVFAFGLVVFLAEAHYLKEWLEKPASQEAKP